MSAHESVAPRLNGALQQARDMSRSRGRSIMERRVPAAAFGGPLVVLDLKCCPILSCQQARVELSVVQLPHAHRASMTEMGVSELLARVFV
eukprot:2863075-Pyramimonas_sp.AAC.2